MGTGKTYFGIFNSGGSVSPVSLTPSDQKNGIYTKTFTWVVGSSANTYLRVYHMASSTTATSTIEWIKLEEGSIATPWCPNPTDTLYTTLGLNSTTVYDCSGFGNNGIKFGAFAYDFNSPKYTADMVFNGNDNSIQTPDLTTMISAADKEYTIACWTYKTVAGTKGYQTIYGGPSGFELEARNGAGDAQYVAWNWGKPLGSYNLGEWTHFVFVHTASDCKIYVNGEYASTGSSAAVPSGDYFIGAWKTSAQQNFEGSLCDFRIYTTALSATDVKSLYQNNAYIDSNGTIYGPVFAES